MLTILKENWPWLVCAILGVMAVWSVARWADNHAPYMADIQYEEPPSYLTTGDFWQWSNTDHEWNKQAMAEIIAACSAKKAKK